MTNDNNNLEITTIYIKNISDKIKKEGFIKRN